MISISPRHLIGKLNDTSRSALEKAAGLCLSRAHYNIEVEHLLLQLLRMPGSDCGHIFSHFRLDLARLDADLTDLLNRLKAGNEGNPAFSATLLNALTDGWVCGSLDYEALRIRSGFFVIALLENEALSKMLTEVTPELKKISVDTLRLNFVSIVEGSIEGREGTAPSPAPGHAFFSYSRKDSGMVAQFAAYLAQEEIPKWIDDQLEYGDSWEKIIVDRIRRSKLLMVLMSENSRKSAFVKREVEIALEERKRIIPILVTEQPFEELKDLQHIHLLDTIHPKTPFIERLRKLLAPHQVPSPGLQRRRLENFILELFEPLFSEGPMDRDQSGLVQPRKIDDKLMAHSGGHIGFGIDRAFKIGLDQSLDTLDELDWAGVFIDIRERLPDLKVESRFGTDFSGRYPTIRALADDLQKNLTWDDIRKL